MTEVPEGFVLELSRTVRASCARVFTTLTEPGELMRWWGPLGFTTPEIEVDLRVGGGYRFGMQPPDGELFHLSGEYLEIEPPSRLGYTFRWEEPDPDDRETVVRLSLQADGPAVTQLSLWQGRFATVARLDLHEAGWTDSLHRLSEFFDAR